MIFIIIAITMVFLDLNTYKTLFMFSCIYFTCQVIGLFIIVTSANSLHFIQFEMIGIYGYRLFTVPTKITQKYHTCIKSISHLSAVPGSITHSIMLSGNSMQ